MNQDVTPIYQPPSVPRFALNTTNETLDGDQGTKSNENGNSLCIDLSALNSQYNTVFTPIGSVNMLEDEIILFLSSPLTSIIGKQDANCNFETLIESPGLNFRSDHYIRAQYSQFKGCEDVIYFTDNFNPPRAINLSVLDQYKINGVFNTDLFRMFKLSSPPCANLEKVNNSGGNLRCGLYYFFTQYETKDGVTTAPVLVTAGIPVITGRYGGTYTELEGGKTLTSKSISINLTGIDTRFSKINIFVLSSVNDTWSARKIKTFSVSSQLSFTYTGNEPASSVEVSELITSKAVYDKVFSMEQIDSRLVMANLGKNEIDWSLFQIRALDIKTTYLTKAFVADQSTGSDFAPKDAGTYAEAMSFLKDEVYSLGIEWIFTDGTVSPVFHIPGRQQNKLTKDYAGITDTGTQLVLSNLTTDFNDHTRATPFSANSDFRWDTAVYDESVVGEYNLRHLGWQNTGDSYRRWEIFNTAIRTEKLSSDIYTKGELAYWQSNIRYPVIKNCNNQYIYPVETVSGNIVGQYIRHHKMPDTTLEPHFLASDNTDYNDGIERNCGLFLEFNNISYPAQYSDIIVGYRIVRAERTFQNSSVLDKGILHRNLIVRVNKSIGPDSYYNYQNPLYNNYNGAAESMVMPGAIDQAYPNWSDVFSLLDDQVSNISLSMHSPFLKFNNSLLTPDYIKIERQVRGSESDVDAQSPGGGIKIYSSKCEYRINTLGPQLVTNYTIKASGYVPADNYVYEGIFEYPFANQSCQETFVIELFDAIAPTTLNDTAINTDSIGGISVCYYASLKKYIPDMYGQIDSIIYIPAQSCVVPKTDTYSGIVAGGDTVCSRLYARKRFYQDSSIDLLGPSFSEYFVSTLHRSWCESTINAELRNQGDLADNCSKYYPKSFTNDVTSFLLIDYDVVEKDLGICPNYYAYNADYSRQPNFYTNFPVASDYDYCSDCNNIFPATITYSEKSGITSNVDAYQDFRLENITTIPESAGQIKNVFKKNNELYVRTSKSLWRLFVRPAQLQTDSGNVYLGTGEILSLPPKELVSSSIGYGGSDSSADLLATEYGVFMADSRQGRVFLLSDKLEEISKYGMDKFLSRNLPSYILQNFEDYPAEVTYSAGVGLFSVFDPGLDRIILFKRDFAPVVEDHLQGWEPSSQGPVWLIYDPSVNDTVEIQNPYNRPDLFENRSFTISYNPRFKQWESFHSYMPSWAFYNSKTFFTVSQGVWSHDSDQHCNFYGQSYPHIIEFVMNDKPYYHKVFTNFLLYSDTYTDNYTPAFNQTFNKIMCYNTTQNTGIQNIVIADSLQDIISYTSQHCLARRLQEKWTINIPRNYHNSGPLFSQNWADIQQDYFIDKVPVNINYSEKQHLLDRLQDKFCIIRLISDDNTLNSKMITSLTDTVEIPVLR